MELSRCSSIFSAISRPAYPGVLQVIIQLIEFPSQFKQPGRRTAHLPAGASPGDNR
jgi:hypothetical protein